ncbi:cytochrome C peroxidase [Fomitiporia mediterranea MF3/22]|uniref:cytochrome C peroxidase n=1 Tax=Fomitiporia mediterranea (strain MF3/22) TaxID=694068 RepID=UPI00044080FA|nr:cytochrome C peroxidase [Fomitiporia mediterranea MF3/22]EJD03072.1 cytochrome C peroxidase [Fomitiporia mediterranea MF3/22]
MSMLAALRTPARRTAFAAAPRAAMRTSMRVRPSLRKYATESAPNPEPKSGSNAWLYGSVGAAALVSVGYYVYATSDVGREAGTAAKSAGQAVKVKANFVPTKEDYQKVYNEIVNILEENGEYDDGSYGPVLVRLAWHSSGTYDKETKTGGSNYAAMRFEPESLHGANNGLNVARDLLEKVKAKFPWISYGDLWTLAGVCAVQEMGGPKIPWRAGRIDGFSKDATPDGRLPDASQGSDHVRNIFYRMGFNDQEIVALLGAHALGRCHTDRSGFEGPWTFSPITFTNDFFTLLFNEKWIWRKWSGPKQLQDKKTGSLMMLPTDYVLVQDKNFKKFAKAYADNQDIFFEDFSKAFAKLLELGVPESQWVAQEPWLLKNTDEQKSQ